MGRVLPLTNSKATLPNKNTDIMLINVVKSDP